MILAIRLVDVFIFIDDLIISDKAAKNTCDFIELSFLCYVTTVVCNYEAEIARVITN